MILPAVVVLLNCMYLTACSVTDEASEPQEKITTCNMVNFTDKVGVNLISFNSSVKHKRKYI